MKKLLVPFFLLCGYCAHSQIYADIGLGFNTDLSTLGGSVNLDIGAAERHASAEVNLMVGSYNQSVGMSVGFNTYQGERIMPFRFYAGPVITLHSLDKVNEKMKWFAGIKHAGVDIRYIYKQEVRATVVFSVSETYKFFFK